MYFENDQEQITIYCNRRPNKRKCKNVTFLIGLFHENELIFRNYFFAENGILSINVMPTLEDTVTIHGSQDSLLGAWHGTESIPVEITGPLFDSGGLYTFEIEIRTIDEPTNIIESSDVYTADLTIVETSTFIEKDSQNNDVEFGLKSYFEKISNFEYDSDAKQVTFEMPFDWERKQGFTCFCST